jgi:hypothetical protein
MPLDQYTGKETGVEIYQDRDGSLWRALGYITSPATMLVNVETKETVTEVIGCPNAERWTRLIPRPQTTEKP